jgi:hypothetical protein
MTVLVQAVLDQAYRYLASGQIEERNKLNGAVDASIQTFELAYPPGGLQSGVAASLGLEIVYVWSVQSSNNRIIVERAQFGSLPQTHDAGTILTVNPRFSYFSMFDELNTDLDSLSSPENGLYQLKMVEIAGSSAAIGYDFPAPGLIDIVDVRVRSASDPLKDWSRLNAYEVIDNADLTDFPSGRGLIIRDNNWRWTDQTIQVRYKAAFTYVSALTDDICAVSGLPTTATDIPTLSVTVNLMSARESKRTFTEAQGDVRRATEVPAGAATAASRDLARQRQQRIREEASRLRTLLPTYRR